MPANSFTINATKRVEISEEIAPDMWQLAIERGEIAPDGTILSPSRIIALFRATDETGRYRNDVEVIRREMSDQPQHHNPLLHNYASVMRQAIINAIIPDVEPYVSLGVAGLTIEQAGPVLMGLYFTLLVQPAPAPEPLPVVSTPEPEVVTEEAS